MPSWGDYNLDLLKSDSHSPTNDFIETNFAYSHIPLICKPTRVTASTATIIDNVFTNRIDESQTTIGILLSDLTDHFPIFFIKHFNETPPKLPEYTLKRSINEGKKISFKRDLDATDWSPVLNETEAQKSYSLFHNLFSKSFEKFFLSENLKRDIKTNCHGLCWV